MVAVLQMDISKHENREIMEQSSKMEIEKLTLEKLLTIQHRKLSQIHQDFSATVAKGYKYQEPMKRVIKELGEVWGLLSYIFDLALSKNDTDEVFETDEWKCLESIETNIRKCILLQKENIQSASLLLIALGVIVAESERSIILWKE